MSKSNKSNGPEPKANLSSTTNFEKALKRLEEIVETLEAGRLVAGRIDQAL